MTNTLIWSMFWTLLYAITTPGTSYYYGLFLFCCVWFGTELIESLIFKKEAKR